jgi:hypothetical protein
MSTRLRNAAGELPRAVPVAAGFSAGRASAAYLKFLHYKRRTLFRNFK